MRVIFVTGSDTGIGKTYVTAAIVRLLARTDLRTQIVKPVETGRGENAPGDAATAASLSQRKDITAFTPTLFSKPLAPLAAAAADGESLTMDRLLQQWAKLPPADLRIVEGAGGIAVPIDPGGMDWADFAATISADRVVLVVPDRLGAINQARLTAAYAHNRALRAGIWLNEQESQPEEIRHSNRAGITLSNLELWATQRINSLKPEDPDAARSFLRDDQP